MPTCHGCEGSFEPEELVRHDHGRLLVVHCPDCSRMLGRYRRHGAGPEVDGA